MRVSLIVATMIFLQYLAKREAQREYGVQNFGDETLEWGYGPVYTFWSNQEYDHQPPRAPAGDQ